MKILLIDDDDLFNILNETIIHRVLPEADVVVFRSGEDFLSHISSANSHSASCDIVFLDIRMPGMSGFEVLEALGSSSYAAIHQAHIFLLSSTLDERDLDRAKSFSRVKQFISKPLTVDIFSQIAETYIQEKAKPKS